MHKTIVITILVLIITLSPFAVSQTANDNKAKVLYFSALSAYDAKEYDEVLTYLNDIEDMLGSSNARISSLKVKALYGKKDLNAAKAELDVFFGFNSSDQIGKEMADYLRKINQEEKAIAKEAAERKKAEEARLAAEAREREAQRAAEIARKAEKRKQEQLALQRKQEKATREKKWILSSIKMATIPGGDFRFGCKKNDEECDEDEKPAINTKVESFKISPFEVTRRQFEAFVINTNYETKAERNEYCGDGMNWSNVKNAGNTQSNEHPVICISYNDTLAFIKWLNEISGRNYRLPTELEWEFAAHGKSKYKYAHGRKLKDICEFENVTDKTESVNGYTWNNPVDCYDGHYFTAPVGSYKPNYYGLYDMVGNVSEITSSNTDKPVEVGGYSIVLKVVKGGSYSIKSHFYRPSSTFWRPEGGATIDTGFRLAQSIEETVSDVAPLRQNDISEGSGIIEPVLKYTVAPDYPPRAAREGITGMVTVEFVISEFGVVTQCSALAVPKADYGFESKACGAVEKWTFEPATQDGKPIKYTKKFNLSFALDG